MKWNLSRWACALIAAVSLSIAPDAAAVVIGGAVTGGSSGGEFSLLMPPPATAGPDQFGSPDLIAFNERQNILLTDPLPVAPDRVIPAGTIVSSHYVAFDPATPSSLEGSVLFSQPILAILGAPPALEQTEPIFGIAAVEYTVGPAIGPDTGAQPDLFRPAPNDRRRMLVSAGANSPGDQVRVLTGFIIPEPASLLMLALSGGGLLGLRR